MACRRLSSLVQHAFLVDRNHSKHDAEQFCYPTSRSCQLPTWFDTVSRGQVLLARERSVNAGFLSPRSLLYARQKVGLCKCLSHLLQDVFGLLDVAQKETLLASSSSPHRSNGWVSKSPKLFPNSMCCSLLMFWFRKTRTLWSSQALFM